MARQEKERLLKVPGGVIKIPEEKFKELEEEISALSSEPETYEEIERNTILNEDILKTINDEMKKMLLETEVESLERMANTGELFPIARAFQRLVMTLTTFRLVKKENKEKLVDIVLVPYEAVLDTLECSKINERVKSRKDFIEKDELWSCTFVSETSVNEINGYKIPKIRKPHTFQVSLTSKWYKNKETGKERVTAYALISKGNLRTTIFCKNPVSLLNGLAFAVAWNDVLDSYKFAYKKRYLTYPTLEELSDKLWEKMVKDAEAEDLIRTGWSSEVIPVAKEKFEDAIEQLKADLQDLIYDEIDVIREKYEIV